MSNAGAVPSQRGQSYIILSVRVCCLAAFPATTFKVWPASRQVRSITCWTLSRFSRWLVADGKQPHSDGQMQLDLVITVRRLSSLPTHTLNPHSVFPTLEGRSHPWRRFANWDMKRITILSRHAALLASHTSCS